MSQTRRPPQSRASPACAAAAFRLGRLGRRRRSGAPREPRWRDRPRGRTPPAWHGRERRPARPRARRARDRTPRTVGGRRRSRRLRRTRARAGHCALGRPGAGPSARRPRSRVGQAPRACEKAQRAYLGLVVDEVTTNLVVGRVERGEIVRAEEVAEHQTASEKHHRQSTGRRPGTLPNRDSGGCPPDVHWSAHDTATGKRPAGHAT
jgi:hypothetical protein